MPKTKVPDAELPPGTGLLIVAALGGAYLVVSMIMFVWRGAHGFKRDAALAAAGSIGALVVGLRRQRAYRAHRDAFAASISADDVLPDDWLPHLAGLLEGEVSPPIPRLMGALPGVIEQAGDEVSAGWFERVVFRREGQELLVYRSYMTKRRHEDRVGPRVYSDRTYLRVRGQSNTHHTTFISVADQSAMPPSGGREAVLGALTFDGPDGEWLKERMPPEAIEILAARPLFIVRCHVGLVEVLWNAEVPPNLLSRFEDAIRLVLLLQRTLRGHESTPFR